MPDESHFIFGGDLPWSPVDWTDSDDRVRGGKSQSYMSANAFEADARFYGNLDIKTLGGAGFASQRTTAEDKSWDLHEYDGVELEIVTDGSDSRKYTLILKDAIPPPDAATGGERSTLSYEYDFVADATELESQTPPSTKPPTSQDEKSSTAPHTPKIRIPFAAFAPTYRGRPQKDAARLNTYRIARWSFMCRSFFGEQEGPFSLKIRSVAAYRGERSALETLFQSRAAMPVVLLVATAVLGRSLVWAIDTFGR